MIGCIMGSSPAGVYTVAVSSVRTSSMDEKTTWLATWQHGMLGEFSRGRVSWVTSNPHIRNLAYGELELVAFSFFKFKI